MLRNVVLLEQGWSFSLGTRECPGHFAPVRLPHDWAAGLRACEDAPASQGYFDRRGVGWYRLRFTPPTGGEGARHYLDFDGVMENSTVWLNGHELGGHGYGYAPFRLEATPHVRPGENEVLVRADCTAEPADRWYSGAGLYRPVRWMVLPQEHLDERSVILRTRFDGDRVTLTIATGTERPAEAVLCQWDGLPVARAVGASEVRISLDHPRRWCAASPYRYRLALRLLASGEVLDEITMPVGFREVSFKPGKGLYVNGERTVLRGVCLHQDMGPAGIAATPEMWRARLLNFREMGANCVRAAHHMHSAAFMDLCDELGFYVYEECFDKWHSGAYRRYFDANWQADVNAMLLRDRNRPCVLIWGVGNEVENQAQAGMIETLKRLTEHVRAIDPTRPVSYAMNPHFKRGSNVDLAAVKDVQAFVDEADEYEIDDLNEKLDCIDRIAEHVDIISCNYQEQWYARIHERQPNKLILGTEIYQYFMGEETHLQNYAQKMPALVAKSAEYIVGGIVWSGVDYLGESMGWPSKGWTGAPVRVDGSRRFSYWMLKSHWTTEPMVRLGVLDYTLPPEYTKEHWSVPPYAEHWDFPHPGVLPFMVATNCERVLLYVNGRELAPPAPDSFPNRLITGYLPYAPGTVEAVGLIGGREVCRHALKTPGPAARLAFEPVPVKPFPGCRLMLSVQAMDAQGTPVLRESRTVSFRAEGPVATLAAGNADLAEHASFSEHTQPLWQGRACAIVALTGRGRAIIRAEADGLEPAQTEISS